MSNMRPAGRMRPFASTPAARTKDTVIWSFNGQNCSFYNLNWINVRRSKKNSMLFFIQNVFYTWKYDRLFPNVKIFFKWPQFVVVCGPHDNTNVTHMALGGPSVWHAWFRHLRILAGHLVHPICLFFVVCTSMKKLQTVRKIVHNNLIPP